MSAPFFIVGSGRCGSSWLYAVLRRHPQIAMTNEARVLDLLYVCNLLASTPHTDMVDLPTRGGAQVRGLVDADIVERFTPVFTRHLKAICEEFYREEFADRDFRWWGEKLPDPRAAVSARYLWPDARYLVLVRDPRDVLVSWRAHAQKEHVAKVFPELVDLPADSLARTWTTTYRGLLRELDDPLVMRYEDLREAPRPHLEKVLEFLELEDDAGLLDDLGAEQLFSKHGTSRSASQTSGRWRSELDPNDVATVESICGEQMREFNYLDDANST